MPCRAKVLLDLQRPPNMSRAPWLHRSFHPCLVDFYYPTTTLRLAHMNHAKDEFWISVYVLLSRPPALNDIVCLRLPERRALDGGPPTYLQQELQRLAECATLQRLDSILLEWGLHEARATVTVTTPLL